MTRLRWCRVALCLMAASACDDCPLLSLEVESVDLERLILPSPSPIPRPMHVAPRVNPPVGEWLDVYTEGNDRWEEVYTEREGRQPALSGFCSLRHRTLTKICAAYLLTDTVTSLTDTVESAPQIDCDESYGGRACATSIMAMLDWYAVYHDVCGEDRTCEVLRNATIARIEQSVVPRETLLVLGTVDYPPGLCLGMAWMILVTLAAAFLYQSSLTSAAHGRSKTVVSDPVRV